jgi:dihydropteroate synthase
LAAFAPWARDAAIYLRPVGLLTGTTAATEVAGGWALRLAGHPTRAFAFAEIIVRNGARCERLTLGLAEAQLWAEQVGGPVPGTVDGILERLSAPRPTFSDHPSGVALMGIVNVTPDSFSDGGDRLDHATAVTAGHALARAGADIVDVGGESTRPGAQPVDPETEWSRVGPVVTALAGTGHRVSIDTRHAATMARAHAAGATMINDVTALTGDPDSLTTAARCGTGPVVLMHMRGEPRTMQSDIHYRDVVLDVYDALATRINACVAAGIARERLVVDPGIGFGKTVTGNQALIKQLALLHGLGCPILLGASRKSFIGTLAAVSDPKARLPGTLAAHLAGVSQGASILRAHDVAEHRQALDVGVV